MSESNLQSRQPLPLKPFLFLGLALLVTSGVSVWFTGWCWPRFGESACGRYVLPIDFLMSLVIFALATLIFDQRWGRLILYGFLIGAMIIAGGLAARWIHSAPASPIPGYLSFLQYLFGLLTRMIYLVLVQALIPAAILRGVMRGDAQRITLKSSALYGAIIGVVFAVSYATLFWLVSVIQTGSVAPGYIFNLNDLLSTLSLALAAFLGVLLGRRLRANEQGLPRANNAPPSTPSG